MRVLLAVLDPVRRADLVGLLEQRWYCVDTVETAAQLAIALGTRTWDAVVVEVGIDVPQIQSPGCRADEVIHLPAGEVAEACALSQLQAIDHRRGPPGDGSLVAGALTLDLDAREARVGNRRVPLKRREYQILKLLMRHRGEVVPTEVLHENVYGWEAAVASNALHVHVHHLRCKLAGEFICTVRGGGFMLRCEGG